MSTFWVDVALWLLASPVLLVRSIVRAFRNGQFLETAIRDGVQCECGETVSLLGLWQCGCGYTYQGHLIRECPVCGTIPVMVRCYACGLTTRLPEAC